MATAYTSGSVMQAAAALMNDPARTLYSYTVQLPFLKMAMQELEQAMDLFDNPYNLSIDAAIDVAANATLLTLPASFFLPISLMERPDGSTSDADWSPMTEISTIDASDSVSSVPTTTLTGWIFRDGNVVFVPVATTAREVKLKYWRMILVTITDESYVENYIGANNFLAYRTAALLATFINKDEFRANSLNGNADSALDMLVSLYTKNGQGIRVRRKPFRRY